MALKNLLTFIQSAPFTPSGRCDFLQVCAGSMHHSAATSCNMAASDTVHYAGFTV